MAGETTLVVNGTARSLASAPGSMLLDVLRTGLGLKAALSAAARVCVRRLPGSRRRSAGACLRHTALVGRGPFDHHGGRDLGTVAAPHPLQSALIAEQAMQCGCASPAS